jgi:poly(beta-D-mannuronate) lyase
MRTETAFLFDLDGTLVDSVYQHVLAWREALESEGIPLSVWRIHRKIGMSGGLFTNMQLRETGLALDPARVERLRRAHAAYYNQRSADVRPLPGARELLAFLSEAEIPWAIATSGRMETAGPVIESRSRSGVDLKRELVAHRDELQTGYDGDCSMTRPFMLAPVGLALANLLWASPAFAATYEVGSLAELQSRIGKAVPGDTIVLRDGAYVASALVAIARPGTAAAPIRIAAKTVGGVTITGAQGFSVTAPAAYVEIVGFVFGHAAGTTQIASGATHIRFSRNVFEQHGAGAYLTIAGDDAEVDHNEFRNKKTVGNMIDVRGAGSQVAQRVRIHHNYFHDFANAGANGGETIRFGLSGLSMSRGFGMIEQNLFVRCTGENELLSIKSGSNTIRYNTFLDSPRAQVTLRHGNENLVYGNYLRGLDGIRIFGDRHQVFSNYLEGNTGGINIGNGDGEVADGAKLTSHDRPDGNVIAFNTLVNNQRSYYMTPRRNGLGATNTVFADNLVQGGGTAVSLDGPYTGGRWDGNVVWQTTGAVSAPVGAFEATDPRLERATDGVFRPRAGSPLIDSAVGEYPAVVVDMDGQPRAGRRDRGADEISTSPIVARPLTVGEMMREIRDAR